MAPEEYVFSRTVAPEDTPDKPTEITIRFEAGDPVAINNEAMSPARLLEELDDAIIESVLKFESAKNISKIFRYLDTNDQALIANMFDLNKQKDVSSRILSYEGGSAHAGCFLIR